MHEVPKNTYHLMRKSRIFHRNHAIFKDYFVILHTTTRQITNTLANHAKPTEPAAIRDTGERGTRTSSDFRLPAPPIRNADP